MRASSPMIALKTSLIFGSALGAPIVERGTRSGVGVGWDIGGSAGCDMYASSVASEALALASGWLASVGLSRVPIGTLDRLSPRPMLTPKSSVGDLTARWAPAGSGMVSRVRGQCGRRCRLGVASTSPSSSSSKSTGCTQLAAVTSSRRHLLRAGGCLRLLGGLALCLTFPEAKKLRTGQDTPTVHTEPSGRAIRRPVGAAIRAIAD